MSHVYKCICGKVHAMKSEGIRCSGKGHNVYLSPDYFEYKVGEKQQKQMKLF